MHARLAAGLFLVLGCADLAWLNLRLAPGLLVAARAAGEQAATAPMACSTGVAEVAPAAVAATSAPESPPAREVGARPPADPPRTEPDVLFGLEADRIGTQDAVVQLLRVARELRADEHARLLLRGHADRLGTPRANLELSRRRAESLRTFLVAHGVPADRIDVEAVGDREPADASDAPTSWARNRRVQIVWR